MRPTRLFKLENQRTRDLIESKGVHLQSYAKTMALLFVLGVAPPLLFILPAFFVSRRKKEKESLLLLFVHVPAVVVWFCLLSWGFGRGASLGNLIEVFFPGIAGIVVAYVKVFWVDRERPDHVRTTINSAILLIVGVVALRLFMPGLPE